MDRLLLLLCAIRVVQTLGPGLAEQSRRNDAPVGRKGRERPEKNEGGRVKERGRQRVVGVKKNSKGRRGHETRVKEQKKGAGPPPPPLNTFGAPL